MADVQQFLLAVSAAQGLDASQQQQANRWLHDFQETQAAWSVALKVLGMDVSSDVLFFTANLLHYKAKTSWKQLGPDDSSQVLVAVRNKVAALAESPQTPAYLLHRLCMALSAMTCFSGTEATQQMVQQALEWAQSGLQAGQFTSAGVALQLLATGAETAVASAGCRRDLVPVMVPHTGAVLALIDVVLAGATPATIKQSALKCLASWLHLTPDPASTCLLTLGVVASQQPEMLRKLMACLQDKQDETQAAAMDVLDTLIQSRSSSCGSPTDPEIEAAALTFVMQLLLPNEAIFSAEDGGDFAILMPRVATLVAQQCPSVMTSNEALANEFTAALVHILARNDLEATEQVLECLLTLNTVPLAERPACLSAEAYLHFMHAAQATSRFPDAFTNWDEEGDLDEGAFHRFREGMLLDFLDTTYGLAGVPYLRDAMAAPASWQALEGGLVCLHAASSSIKKLLLSSRPLPGREEERQLTNELMIHVFTKLTEAASEHNTQPYVRAAICKLIGDWAAWFAREPRAPLLAAVSFVLQAAPHAQSLVPSCTAFWNLSARNADKLCADAILSEVQAALFQLVTQVRVGGGNADSDAKVTKALTAALEGAARIVAQLPDAAQAPAAQRLCQPMLASLQQLATLGPAVSAHATSVAHNLPLVAAVLRFLDIKDAVAAASDQHPVVQIMASLLPLISALTATAALSASEGVTAAVCDVYERAITAAAASRAHILLPIVHSLQSLLTSSRSALCLDCLARVAESAPENTTPTIPTNPAPTSTNPSFSDASPGAEALRTSLPYALASVSAWTSTSPPSDHSPELLASALGLASRFLLFHPLYAYSGGSLAPALDLALRALRLRERAPVQNALQFLMHLLAPPPSQAAALASRGVPTAAIESSVVAHCDTLVQQLLLTACSTCPRDSLGKLGKLLHALLSSQAYGARVAAALVGVLLQGAFAPVASSPLSAADCQRFCTVVARSPLLPAPRFSALMTDFAGIAQGDALSDVLIAYEC